MYIGRDFRGWASWAEQSWAGLQLRQHFCVRAHRDTRLSRMSARKLPSRCSATRTRRVPTFDFVHPHEGETLMLNATLFRSTDQPRSAARAQIQLEN